jgi:hypothetical protein
MRMFLAAFCSLVTFAAAADSQYFGSKLADLEPLIAEAPNKALVIIFPPSENFTPNINIQVQPFAGTMKEYIEISRQQLDRIFNQEWAKPLEDQKGEKEYLIEAIGITKGRNMHFYARAVKHETKVYLITGVALETQWKAIGDTLRRHVDSFRAP